jgi:hypothetical protein
LSDDSSGRESALINLIEFKVKQFGHGRTHIRCAAQIMRPGCNPTSASSTFARFGPRCV